jgi:hypothetical protein
MNDKRIEKTTDKDIQSPDCVLTKLRNELKYNELQNKKISMKLKKEIEIRDELNLNILKIKKEILLLKENSYLKINQISHNAKNHEKLKDEYDQLQNEKESLLDKIEEKLETRTVDDLREKKEKSNLNIATTMDEIYNLLDLKIQNKKSSSIILTSVREVIEVISVNEFSNLKWGAKISEGSTHYGTKIRFRNMNTQYSELKSTLRPVIQKVSNKFKAFGLDIKTKIKTSPGEVVEALEITFIVKKALDKQIQITE